MASPKGRAGDARAQQGEHCPELSLVKTKTGKNTRQSPLAHTGDLEFQPMVNIISHCGGSKTLGRVAPMSDTHPLPGKTQTLDDLTMAVEDSCVSIGGGAGGLKVMRAIARYANQEDLAGQTRHRGVKEDETRMMDEGREV